jgi:hypothetical protein
VKETLDRTPPELASDIMDRGIMLAGGGSLLQGLDERLREETQMPAHLAESPLTCVAVGSGRSLEEFEVIHRANKNSKNRRAATSGTTPGFRTSYHTLEPSPRVRQDGPAAPGSPRTAHRQLPDPSHRVLRRVRRRRPARGAARHERGPQPRPGGRQPRAEAVRDLFGWFGDTLAAKGKVEDLTAGARPAAPELAVRDNATYQNQLLAKMLETAGALGLESLRAQTGRVSSRRSRPSGTRRSASTRARATGVRVGIR